MMYSLAKSEGFSLEKPWRDLSEEAKNVILNGIEGRKVRFILGQSATTLSGGEAQRIKLAAELSKLQRSKHTLYILDEPTTGLHLADIQRLLDCLHRLVEAGHTVLAIEHHMDVIKTADHVIDLGPEGGHAGGQIVVTGTPEQVAASEASHTGRFLRSHLGGR
jgi:excinuclease ABC subunit A